MFINKNINFSQKAINNAVEHCRKQLPNEGCGIFINDEFIPFKNKSENPEKEFIINDSLFDSYFINKKIQCIIHSHNNYPHASKQDQIQQKELEIPFGIINFRNGGAEHFLFFGNNIPINPLKNRPFFFGIFDCLSLVRDYTYSWSNILIPCPVRDFDYWKNNESLFEDHIENKTYPVKYININDLKTNDMILYKFDSKFINHIGVLLPNGKVLHHFVNRVSCELPFSFYQQNIYKIGRLNTLWDGIFNE
jgi:proteasome lid subunit RPN8/RPN11